MLESGATGAQFQGKCPKIMTWIQFGSIPLFAQVCRVVQYDAKCRHTKSLTQKPHNTRSLDKRVWVGNCSWSSISLPSCQLPVPSSGTQQNAPQRSCATPRGGAITSHCVSVDPLALQPSDPVVVQGPQLANPDANGCKNVHPCYRRKKVRGSKHVKQKPGVLRMYGQMRGWMLRISGSAAS